LYSVFELFYLSLQVAVYGGLVDRVHDLLLCGVDPFLVDLSPLLSHVQGEEGDLLAHQETETLIGAASHPWIPSHHAYLFGPEFRACIASVCLVKVKYIYIVCLTTHQINDTSIDD
jgi:hypothetical protein